MWIHKFSSKAVRFVFLYNVVAICAFAGFVLGHKKEHTSAGLVLSSVA